MRQSRGVDRFVKASGDKFGLDDLLQASAEYGPSRSERAAQRQRGLDVRERERRELHSLDTADRQPT